MGNNHKGFTLIELLVAMTVGLVVMAGVSMTFQSQQKSYLLQEQMAAMQQNLRAAMYHMEREIRMAGCDPNQTASAQVVTANATSINFTQDIRGATEGSQPDGDTNDPNENITYYLNDSDGDGFGDELKRNDTNPGGIGDQVIADNISALNFVYLRQDGTRIDDDGAGNVTVGIPQIRSVEITLLARTGRGDRGFQNNTVYTNQAGDPIFGPAGDNRRRKLLTTCIKCRNLGL
jgi:type IV pilus assembly protein PilW